MNHFDLSVRPFVRPFKPRRPSTNHTFCGTEPEGDDGSFVEKDADAVSRSRHRHFHGIRVLKLLASNHLPEEGMTSIDHGSS